MRLRLAPHRGWPPFGLLNVVDEYTRIAVGFDVARSIGARRVQQVIERLLAEQRSSGRLNRTGVPELICSDKGKEFTSSELVTWLATQGIACYVEGGGQG